MSSVTLLAAEADDLAVVNAARVSLATTSEWEEGPSMTYGAFPPRPIPGTLSEKDAGLIKFLMRERHGTPFEHGYFRFRVEAPIFVFREWHRHRAGHSYNEMSGRYTELEKRFYDVIEAGPRTQTGKPGAYRYEPIESLHDQGIIGALMEESFEESWKFYQSLLEMGLAKEQARAVLPVGIYSQMIWSCNPRSLMHFLSLRNAETAMQEIRNLAAEAEQEFQALMPVTAQAFIENGRIAP